MQHFPLKQVLISANLSKIVRPVAKELLKTNSPLANLVTIALTVPLVIASCFSPPIFQDHTYTYIHAVDVIQLVGVHMYGELITARLYFAFYATVHQPYMSLQNDASSFHPREFIPRVICNAPAGQGTPLSHHWEIRDMSQIIRTW